PGAGERLVGLYTFVYDDENFSPLSTPDPGATPQPLPSGNAFHLRHTYVGSATFQVPNLAVVWAEFASFPASPAKSQFYCTGSPAPARGAARARGAAPAGFLPPRPAPCSTWPRAPPSPAPPPRAPGRRANSTR